ncbi:hypothetical protein Rhow_008979 [Rhodococcus wratislaviensis]|uniref:MaoC-like domain-containing protein n=1 Tax=Rhodococcus wratislaviensis TaxID=44752 RepID=A0A402CM38_RHOWR|nr:MaoC/PaaZ C-terminal domain-containing protein [Rhodococcus wratislaviensis]GCE44558.1 hypothetical protein Rhow_008979 [Rhodococcus wratislaviensis]
MNPVVPGTKIPTVETVVDAEAMKVFSLITKDPNPIHWDLDSVQKAGLGDRAVNQGGLNVGYVVNALCQWTGSRDSVRRVKTRFLKNAYAGDVLTAGGTVSAVDRSTVPNTAELTVWLRRADGDEIMSGTATIQLPEREDFPCART